MKDKVSFSTMTETWFDDIAHSNLPNKVEILNMMTHVANKINLIRVVKLLELNSTVKGIKEVINHANFIIVGEFNSEFRFRYTNPKGHKAFSKQVSVTSEFFSMLRQSLTYNELED